MPTGTGAQTHMAIMMVTDLLFFYVCSLKMQPPFLLQQTLPSTHMPWMTGSAPSQLSELSNKLLFVESCTPSSV